MSLADLLRFAEDVSSFIDPDKIRVCLPPFEGADDCVLLLDGVNEVPSPTLWYSIDRETGADGLLIEVDTSSNDIQPLVSVKEPTSVDTPYHTHKDPESEKQESNSPMSKDSTPTSPESAPFAPKVLFSPACCELSSGFEEPVGFLTTGSHAEEKVVHLTADTAPTTESTELVDPILAPVNDATLETLGESIEAPKFAEPAPEVQPIPPGFDAFLRLHKDRVASLHTESAATKHTTGSGEVVFYHVTQTFRVEDNLSLYMAMKLSAELNLPVVALVTVESEIVADATSSVSAPPQHHPVHVHGSNVVEDTPRCSAGGKRKLSDAVTGDGEWEDGYYDHRTVTLKGLHRKNYLRMDTILKLKEDLAALNVPLVVIEYDASSPGGRLAASGYSTSCSSTGAVSGSVAVTPLRSATDRVHPIAHILIAVSTITTSTTTTTTGQAYAVSGQKPDSSTPGGDASSCAGAPPCRAAALFTDDLLHPLDRHVYRAVAEALPSLPVYCADSTGRFVLRGESEKKHFGTSDASAVMSFKEYCECVGQQGVVEQGQQQNWPCTLQELSAHFPQSKDYPEQSIEEYLRSSRYGTVCNLQRHHFDPQLLLRNNTTNSPTTDLSCVMRGTRAPARCVQQCSDDLMTTAYKSIQRELLYVQYGRYLCRARAGDLQVLTPPTAGAGWSVPWLNILSSNAPHSVKEIDAVLRKATARSGEIGHSRRQRLLRLRGGNTNSEVYNSITRELYEHGGVMGHEKLVHWIVYCVFELGSVLQAIQYTYTVLATHSDDNFASSVGQVSLFTHALDDVIGELVENLLVYSGTDGFDHFVTTLLAKHAVNV